MVFVRLSDGGQEIKHVLHTNIVINIFKYLTAYYNMHPPEKASKLPHTLVLACLYMLGGVMRDLLAMSYSLCHKTA